MFLFESSKEKAIRQDVEKSMETCISNPKKYNEAKEILAVHLRGADQKVIEMIVDNIKSTIKNEDYQPVRKYQAMLLLKDLMLTHNKALGKYVVKKVLKRLTILAQHKSGTKDVERDQERARDIFGSVKKDQEQYAVRFFNTLLTALQQWGKNWPKAPDGPYKDFHRQYNDLLMNGVQFPKERPKELTKTVSGVTGGRMSREQSKIPAVQPASPPKSKLKQKEDKKIVAQAPPPPKRQSKISQHIVKGLDQYFEGVKEAVKSFNELLPAFAADEVPVIVDIVGQIQKTVQAGNQLVIQIGGDGTYQNDSLKIEKCFDLITKVQKDLKILTKKPQQLEVFKSKYIKLSNQLLTTLAKSRTSVSISPIKQEEKKQRSKVDPSPQIKRQEPTPQPQPEVKIEQKPKIATQNRYASVHGNQVLQNFAKNVEYHSNSGQSVHSDRFGSFGGPTNADKHKITIPNANGAGGSPQVDQGKKKANTDRRQLSVDEVTKSITVIPEQKSISISRKQLQSGNFPKQAKNMQEKPSLASQKLFKQFEGQKKMSEKGSVKNGEAKFEDNSSFGPHNFDKIKPQFPQQEDFFAKVEQNAKQQNKDIVQNPRRKKNHPKQDNEDFFKVRMESQIDSSKLSGFQFSKGIQGSKLESKNVQNISEKQQQTGSKKEVFQDNPFGLDNSQNQSKNQDNQSNFFDPFEKGSDIFGKSTVTHKIKSEANEVQANPKQQNPFATGNFGNMVQRNVSSANPFDNESMKSKKQPHNNANVNDNPFGNSFQKSSKASKPARQSINSHHSQNKGNQNNNVQNPFQSRGYNPSDNIFGQRLNNSRNHHENPFQTQTQRSNKSRNPFEQVQDFYKPPSHHLIEGLSQRNSFKNIQTGQRNEIIGGNLGVSGFPQPIRDSLVFSAKVDKEASQYGLNFSQFQDVGVPETQQRKPQPRNSDPFNTSSKKQDHQFSGFSLSNFPGIGEQQNQKQNPVDNGSAADFFANFQKESIKSKKSKQKVEPLKKSLKEQKQKNVFDDFFANNNSFSNESKSEKRKSNKNQNADNFVYERQKTVLSGEQKSFDFTNLDKSSAIQNKGKPKNDFDALTEGGKPQTATKRQQKQGFVIDNKSQKSLSWGDFSARPDEIFDKRQDRSEKDSNDARSNKLLQVQSRINIVEQPKEGQSKEPTSRVNRLSNEPSLDLQLEDFTPIVKKGIQWNPLNKITILKKSPYTYNVNDKKIEQKKQELLQKQRQYNQKLQIFKFARRKNDEIRNILMQKMKKVQDIIHQKTQYQQILKKLKETNGIKENQIQQLYAKIKKTETAKIKILQKEKQLYELTKNQIYVEQKKAPAQRSMASKWQMFNKNLEHNRNSLQTIHSQYTNGF